MPVKVIFFTGGVYSSLGKGLVLASTGRLLIELGFKVSVLKCDPYLNVNSGDLSPHQHGEVFVTYDGNETDLDLGQYERVIGHSFSRLSQITSGKIYKKLLEKQCSDFFEGDTVQIVPHFVNEVHGVIEDILEKESDSDFLLIEIGGTVGDDESNPFIEAVYRFIKKHGQENVLLIHLSPIFYLPFSNEYKTKPTQYSLKRLSEFKISPDILMLRCSSKPPLEIKNKFFISSQIPTEDIVFCVDVISPYLVVENLYSENFHEKILKKLSISLPKNKNLENWKNNTKKIVMEKTQKINVALISDYFDVSDEYISVLESIKIASYHLGVEVEIKNLFVEKLKISELKNFDAVCLPSCCQKKGFEEKIKVVEYCRVNNVPFLGICTGLHFSIMEYSKNVLGIFDNDSEILSKKYDFFEVVEDKKFRLGNKKVKIVSNTLAYKIFGKNEMEFRHRHWSYLSKNSFLFKKLSDCSDEFVVSGFSNDEYEILEIIEIKNHKFFISTQFRPEFDTTFDKPSPLFLEFLRSSIKI